jgi:hypothetical protein
MSPATVFALANTLAMITWAVLLLRPRWATARGGIVSLVAPLMFSAAYVLIVAAEWGSAEGGFSSLAEVAALFRNEWMLLAGWLHYLAFDILVGRWELTDAQARGIPHLLVVPCLLVTFLFGPAGWLLYLAVRAAWFSRSAPRRS